MNISELEEIIKQILDNNLLVDFHDRLKERLNEEYSNITLEKLHCRYNIKDPEKYGTIAVHKIDFINREIYIQFITDEARIVRFKCTYEPKLK